MEIVFHSHNASVSEQLRRAALRGLEKVARRLTKAVRAVVRFEEDGPLRRVEIVLHAARGRLLIGEAWGRTFAPALTAALAHVEAQTYHIKRTHKPRKRRSPAA